MLQNLEKTTEKETHNKGQMQEYEVQISDQGRVAPSTPSDTPTQPQKDQQLKETEDLHNY